MKDIGTLRKKYLSQKDTVQYDTRYSPPLDHPNDKLNALSGL